MSCENETVTCVPGLLEVYGVNVQHASDRGCRVWRYVAGTSSVVDSAGIYLHNSATDTQMLLTMIQGFDYRLQLNDSTTYVFNNLLLEGRKTQTYRHSIANTKKYGCTDRAIGFNLNGARVSVIPDNDGRAFISLK